MGIVEEVPSRDAAFVQAWHCIRALKGIIGRLRKLMTERYGNRGQTDSKIVLARAGGFARWETIGIASCV